MGLWIANTKIQNAWIYANKMVEIQKDWDFYSFLNILYGLKPIKKFNSLVSPIDSDDIREW